MTEVKGNMDHHMDDFFRSAEDNKDIILEKGFKKKKLRKFLDKHNSYHIIPVSVKASVQWCRLLNSNHGGRDHFPLFKQPDISDRQTVCHVLFFTNAFHHCCIIYFFNNVVTYICSLT